MKWPDPRYPEVERLRSRYISANEHVHRLHNRGAPLHAIEHAEREREAAAEQWRLGMRRAEAEEGAILPPIPVAPPPTPANPNIDADGEPLF